MTTTKATQQHFLPRFLTKGFASRTSGREVYIQQYRLDGGWSEPNIKNVGAGRDFYGSTGPGTLDDEITGHEDRSAPLLDHLRDEPRVHGRHSQIAELVAHLMCRTRHFREGAGAFLADHLNSILELLEGDQFRHHLELAVKRRVDADPKKRAWFAGMPEEQQMRYIDEQLHVAHSRTAEFRQQIDAGREASAAHNLALVDEPDRWVQHLAPLAWSVVKVQGGSLILGDAGPIAQFNQAHYEHPMRYQKTPRRLVLPISKHLLLVGTPDESHDGDEEGVDAHVLNLQTAELSREFLICAQHTDLEDEYAACLCERGELMSRDEARALAIEQLKDSLREWGVPVDADERDLPSA